MTLLASGQVAYGTWLTAIPSPAFVFVSLLLTAAFFLVFARQGARLSAWKPLLLLNFSTALAFLSFFYALKTVEPAIASALNVGVGPLFAVVIAALATGTAPALPRLVVCLGILCGCAILAFAAAYGPGEAGGSAWPGILASIATGLGAVLVTLSSRSLLDRGWRSGAVLAHRFYLALPASFLLATATDLSAIEWSGFLAAVLLAVSVFGVLAPLYLLQIGIRHCEPYVVMVMLASMPLVTFVVQGFSPAYAWTWMTALGLAIVTGFILIDAFSKKS